ncbi:large subunit ribosomal protein L34e [Babesia microti strain RI]|uniref:Large subunit ribosomal protein L34e n=1 Tax=Babesia microti (strain RI) TaxID=1133968 RepID=I7J8G8_BABMR|nr:large subunit ribosomal protein L34e [Babesia microti strain RI]CCF72849.1 large subunit ribosomal protein L34e [Babesia microti strain RI]|eukprot:XP_012647458.1 large subunit ribosomal protein L34e [Babesia microti strain RI]
MSKRVTLRRHNAYHTRSNFAKKVKTPGARVVFQHLKKKAKPALCGDCKGKLQGVVAARPEVNKNLKRRQRKVYRVYGGSLCHKCVRDRIIRAFLKEEQKCVKKVVEERVKQKKAAGKG